MKKKQAGKTILLVMLVFSFVMGILPIQAIQTAMVSAEQAEGVAFDDFSWTLEAAQSLLDAGDVLSSGEWQYVRLPDTDYAVITGHTGTQALALNVPDMLDGADVVALASGALADHAALEHITLHGNIFAIGDRAIPRGVTLRALNASYAQTYASQRGYAFEREAEFDLRTGVVDLADVRPENIERVSQSEVKLRALEAHRLSVGGHFFYIDPNNAYQISFYTVSSMADLGDGFVRVSCITPDVDSVLRSYSGVNEELMLDPASVKLYEGATLNTGNGSRITLGPYDMPEIAFDTKKLKSKIKIDGFELAAMASIKPSYRATFTGGFVSSKTLKIVEERKIYMEGSIKYDNENSDITGKRPQKEIHRLSEYAKTYAGNRGISKTMRSHTIPLGGGIVFSYAGLVNVDVAWGLTFELNGSISFSYGATMRTTYTWDESNKGHIDKKVEKFDEKTTMSAEASLKVGGTIYLNVRIVAARVFSAGLFIGIQANISYMFDDTATLPNLNMLDCMNLDVRLIAELSLKLAEDVPGVDIGIEGKRILDHELGTFHFHCCEYELDGEQEKREFHERFHVDDDCPYDMKHLKVALPWVQDGTAVAYQSPGKYLDSQKILINLKDGEGNVIYEPEMAENPGSYLELDVTIDQWESYNRRLDSIHTDMSFDSASKIKEWPYKLGDGPTLYLNAVPLYQATILYSDGTKQVEKYAAGEKVHLSRFVDDELVKYWVRVKSEQDLTIIERIGWSIVGSEVLGFSAEMPDQDAWYHPVCLNDIEMEFYLGNGETYKAFAPGEVGALIEAPTIAPTLPRYQFDGWKDKTGQRVTFPLTTTQEMIDARKLIFEAIWKETGEITAEDLENCGIGTAIARPDGYFNVDPNSADYLNYSLTGNGLMVTGLKANAPENLNLKIPSKLVLNGVEHEVNAIVSGAFEGETKLRSVEVPDSVTTIGSSAFKGCTNLELLHMSACTGLTALPDSMASGCVKLECVLIPGGIRKIGASCFAGCALIREAYLNADIGNSAFSGCTSLAHLGLGAGVTSISNLAFRNCLGLTEFSVPDSVQSLGERFIEGSVNIRTLTFNGRPRSVSPGHLNIGEGSLLETVVFGPGVNTIGEDAMSNGGYGFANLKNVTISSTVTSIGFNAFSNTTIENLEIHAGSGLVIERSTFNNCQSLETLKIFSGIIGGNAFQQCTSLKSLYIGPLVQSIGMSAFAGCTALTQVQIDEGVQSIGKLAFADCSQLQSIAFPDSVASYGDNMILRCSSLEELTIGGGCKTLSLLDTGNPFRIGTPNVLKTLTIREGVTAIGAYVFTDTSTTKCGDGFETLTTVKLPQSLTAIGSYAFANSGLKEIEIPENRIVISSGAFADCTKLIRVKINGISNTATTYAARAATGTIIGSETFKGCSNLQEIIIKDGVTSIGAYAFQGMTSLKKIEFPDSVTSYGNRMLEGCVNLEDLTIGGGCPALTTTQYSNSASYRYAPFYIGKGSNLKKLTIREGVTSIGKDVFSNTDTGNANYKYTFPNLEEICLPESLKTVDDYAFLGTAVKELKLSENVSSIGSYAFAESRALKTLTIDGNVLTLGNNAFENAKQLERATLHGVKLIGNNAFSGASSLREVTLEEGLQSIGAGAFDWNASLKKLVIPDSVTSYGHNMIRGCLALEELTIGGGDPVLEPEMYSNSNSYMRAPFYIGEGSSLKRLIIREGVTALGNRIFANGTTASDAYSYWFENLETVVLPQTLQSIGNNAFAHAGLKSIEIPPSVTSIGSNAFYNCKRLEKLNLAGTGLVLGQNAFAGNTALWDVTIEEGVKSIGEYAFQGMTSLKKIEFPDSVTSYGNRMLEGCVNLEDLTIGGGCLALTTTQYSNSASYMYAPFYIGKGSNLKKLTIREGVTSIGKDVLANTYSAHDDYRFKFSGLQTVILPESLTTIDNYNLSSWPSVTALYLGANIASMKDSGSIASMTFYTEAFNEIVDAFASAKGCMYLVRDPATFPKFMFTRVSSVAETHGALYVSDGTQMVTSGLEGETSLLEAGYAVLSEEEVYYRDEVLVPEDVPQAEGYVFGGWYADPEYTMTWTGGMMPACDLTLYARMLPISDVLYAVDVPEAGTADERLPEGYALYALDRLAEGEALLPPVAEAEGRIFDDWYLDAEGTQALNPRFDRMPAQDLIVYGRFVPQAEARFVVNLPAGMAVQSAEIPEGFSLYQTVTATIGEAFAAPSEPVAEGYVFSGWFKDPSFEYAWTSRTMPEEGALIYGCMTRLRAGGVYTLGEAGYTLKRYVLEQDEDSEVYLPAKVNGIPVVSISSYAFREDEITRLHLPENLVTYDSEAFSGMSQLMGFAISENNPYFTAKDGVLYSKDMTVLCRYPRGKTKRSFTIPSSVTAIAPRAFEHCSRLQTIVLPDGLNAIGEHAFDGCSALTAMALPDGVTAIKAGTFANCGALCQLTAYGVTSVAEQAIPFNMNLSIRGPLGSGALRDYCMVRSNGTEAMIISYNLHKVKLYIDGSLYSTAMCEAGLKLPAMMESGQRDDGSWITGWFTDAALTEPWSFASDLMPDEDIVLYTASRPVYESVEQTFVIGSQEAEDGTVIPLTKTGLLLTAYHGDGGVLMLPRSMNGMPVLGLGEGFLAGANGIVEKIDIGSDVVFIADTALVSPAAYPFGRVVRADMGSYAAQWAIQMGYTVEGSVYTLSFETYGAQLAPKQAGAGVGIKLPTPVKTGAAFIGWYMDEFLTKPVTLDADGLFIMPPSDTTLYAAWDGEGEIYPFSYEEANGSVVITGYLGVDDELTIPEMINGMPVTAIGESAFEGDTLLRSVTLPQSVKRIESCAFAGSIIRTVDLGGATEIGNSAFARCTQLSSVTMNSVENIGEYAFRGCIMLRTLALPDSLRNISSGAYTGCTGIGSVTLPAGVEAVQANAFSGCISLKQAHLGMAYYVDVNAFAGCTALHTYTTDEGNMAYSAQDGVLMTADGMGMIRYPIARTDAGYVIAEGVTDVADSAFAGAKHLTSVTVPASVTWIGSEAFKDCVKLAAFELPAEANVTAIARNTFSGCSSLKSVRLSASVTSIGDGAFSGCNTLAQVEIPPEITFIGEHVFAGDSQMLIIGKTGSTAHQYAADNGYLFRDPDAPQVQQLILSAASTVLQRGEMMRIVLESEPAEALEATAITWRCGNPDVALVDNGVVHAIGGGSAEIIAQADNGVTGSIVIEVQVAAKSVSIIEIPRAARGMSIQAEAVVLPESATNKICTWASSDERVFTVDEAGIVTCMGEGTATLTATTHNGLTAQTDVTVFNAVETIEVSLPEETLYAVEGLNTLQLEPIVLPLDATDLSVLYASSDETVASVDENGFVTAHMPGQTVITLTAADGHGVFSELVLEVSARDLSVLRLPGQVSVVYDTLAHRPQLDLEMDGIPLVEGTDYVITNGAYQEGDEPIFEEKVDVGVYCFTVTGVGNYCGSFDGELVIIPAQPEITYTGGEVFRLGSVKPSYVVTPPVASVVFYMRVEDDGTLTELEGFPTQAGEYRMYVAVPEMESHASAELEIQFTLVDDWFHIDYSMLYLRKGQSAQLVNRQLPQELAPVPVVYTSDNTAVASVDSAGRITGVAEGTAIIMAATQDGEGVQQSFAVTVGGLERELSVPGLLRTIETEAFADNASIDVLTLGEHMEEIGSRAFADMTSLRQVHLPVSLESIAEDAFAGVSDLTVFCEEGSEAHQYAQRVGIPYVFK